MFNVSINTDIENRTAAKTAKKPRAALKRLLSTSVFTAGLIAAHLIATSVPVHAQTPAPAAASGSSTAVTPKPKRALTPGQVAARERQTKCAAEWKAAKAAGKVEKDMKWPKYWSACNKRLKGAG